MSLSEVLKVDFDKAYKQLECLRVPQDYLDVS